MTEPRHPGPRAVPDPDDAGEPRYAQPPREPYPTRPGPRERELGPDGPPPWDHHGPSGRGDRWDRWDEPAPARPEPEGILRGLVRSGEAERLAIRLVCYLLWLGGAMFGAYGVAMVDVWAFGGCVLLMFAGGAPWVIVHRADHAMRMARQAAELDRQRHEPRRPEPVATSRFPSAAPPDHP